MNSSWKAKAASNIPLILLLWAGHTAFAQLSTSPVTEKKITLTCRHVRLEDALLQLSQKASVLFVYSANTLELDRPVSFTAYDQPLDELLGNLGRGMNISFIRYGDHVVVKTLPPVKTPVTVQREVVRESGREPGNLLQPEPDPSLYEASLQPQLIPAHDLGTHLLAMDTMLFTSYKTFKNAEFRTKLDSVILRSVRKNARLLNTEAAGNPINRQGFVSLGLFANDFTYSGLELHAGITPFYGVINASIVNNNLYRIGYGVGSTFTLKNRWDMNIIYTFAQLEKDKDLIVSSKHFYTVYKDAIKLKSIQHQIKIMAQYNLSPRLAVQFGPSFNLLSTRYRFKNRSMPVSTVTMPEANVPVINKPAPQPGHDVYIQRPRDAVYSNKAEYLISDLLRTSNTIIPPYTLFNSYSDNNYLNTRGWIGFEISFSYRINFSGRP